MPARSLSIPTLFLALTAFTLQAQSAHQQQRFAGTWEAKFKGAVICTIKLEAGEKLSGATYGCNIQVNQDGDLVEAQPAEHADEPSPIVNAKIEGDKLTFDVQDGDDTLKFEFTLAGESRADLRFIDAPLNIKPVHFEKR
jgi:hypothetical protein